MKSLIKACLAILGAAGILLIAGFIYLSQHLTPSTLKTLIEQQVNTNAKVTLSLKGDVTWTFYPQLSLHIKHAVLTNNDNAHEHIDVGELNIGLKLLPLLRQELAPTQLTLNQVHYHDDDDHVITLEQARLKTPPIALDRPFPLDLSLRIIHQDQFINIHLLAETTVARDLNTLSLKNYRLQINQEQLTGNVTLTGLNEKDNPASLINRLSIDGHINSPQLTLDQLTLHSIHADIHASNGIYTLSPATLTLYNGVISGMLSANLQQAQPRYHLQAQGKDIATDSLLKALTGTPYLSGHGTLLTELDTAGTTIEALTEHLNGHVNLAILEGQVNHHALVQQLQIAGRLLHQRTEREGQLKFNQLSTQTQITNGLGNVKGQLLSNDLEAATKGQVNLVDQTLKLHIDAQYLKANRTKDIIIPIDITGDIESPTITLDAQNIVQQVAKQQGNQLLEQASHRLGQLDLSGLFGR